MQMVIFVLAAILAYIIKLMFFGPVTRVDAALVGIFMANYVVLMIVFSLFASSSEEQDDPGEDAGEDPEDD